MAMLTKPATLAAYLEEKEITQTAFAEKLGVSQGAVWQWLNGVTEISPKRARQIEKVTRGAVRAVDLRPDIFEELAA